MKNPIDPNEYQDPRLKNLLDLLEPVPPRSAADEMDTRKRFMADLDDIFAAAPAQPQSRLPKWLASLLPAQRRPGSSSQRFAFSTVMAMIAIFALLFGGAGATALAAQSSIPGDVLYPVKTGLEGAQLTLATDAYAQAQLHLSFAQRRLDEIAGLIQTGRTAEIDGAAVEFQRQIDLALERLNFLAANDPTRAADLARQITAALSRYAQVLSGLTAQAPETVRPALQQALQSTTGQAAPGEVELLGVVEAMSASTWTVSGETVLITPATEIKSSINLGDTVKIHASPNADGTFTAREIELSAASGNENDENLNQNSGNDDNGLIDDNENDNLDDHENLNENQDDNDNDDNENGDNESSLPGNETRFVGVVESISATSLTVSGLTLIITPQTELDSSIAAGDSIEVRAVRGTNGRLIAVRLRLEGKSSGSQQNDNTNSGGNDSQSNQNDSGNSNSGQDSSGNSNDDSNDNNSGSGSGKSGGSNKNDNSSNGNDDNGGSDDNDNG